MKIVYTLPNLTVPHGGYVIVCQHIKLLQAYGHDVSLYVESGECKSPFPDRYNNFAITRDRKEIRKADIVVVGSPHSLWVERFILPHQRLFYFLQMDERLFRPNDKRWAEQCEQVYRSKHPIICGASHVMTAILRCGRSGDIHYIGDGVNTDHFPIKHKQSFNNTVLIEGWESSNPAKDTDYIAPQVAEMLKNKYKCKVIAYGFSPLRNYAHVVDQYIMKPDLITMNRIYEEADILIKASKYDSRALSPMEAMTKGTVTARAIIAGDDALIHESNCLRSGYDKDMLYNNAERLLTDHKCRSELSGACNRYVMEYSWEYWGNKLKDILTIN